jgi:hypothetical protein
MWELDLALLAAVIRAYGDFDLLAQKLTLSMPTLYLTSSESFRPTVTGEVFKQLVPQAEVQTTQLWITHYHQREAGSEFSSAFLPFIEKHRRETD